MLPDTIWAKCSCHVTVSDSRDAAALCKDFLRRMCQLALPDIVSSVIDLLLKSHCVTISRLAAAL